MIIFKPVCLTRRHEKPDYERLSLHLPIKLNPLKRSCIILILVLCLPGSYTVLAQSKDNSIPLDHFYVDRVKGKRLLSFLHISFSTGYGSTTFKHEFQNLAIFQPAAGGNPIVYDPITPTVGFTNWFNKGETAPITINPGDFTVSSEDSDIGFKSKSFNIPLKLTLHAEFLKRFRAGIGYSFEFTKVKDFEPTSFGNDINNYSPEVSSFFLKKYFVLLGASVYRYNEYLLTIDANIGGYGLGKDFDKDQIKRGVFINLGATVEREMSEYFRLFVRPSYEIKSFDLSIPTTDHTIKHKMNAFYINIGATYRIPELRRCFHKQCKAQINHAHGNKEYRSRVHPIWKKQNPHTGENYPELIKYKGKNKRKFNPY